MDDFDTVASSQLFICASAPATNDAAGFAALTWTEVGSITNMGSVKGREYSTSTASTIGNAQDREKKGSYKLPPAEMECLWADDDDGQRMVEDAANDYSIPSFKVKKQNGKFRYFTAQVSKAPATTP
jgi:hypothetical protein